MLKGSAPDRPLSRVLVPVRGFIRCLRIAKLRLLLGRRLLVGNNVAFGSRAYVAPPEYAKFGDNVRIGSDFHLETNLEVGSDVLISSRVSIVGNDHDLHNPEFPVFGSKRNAPSVVILEGDNLIGHGSIIVGSVRVGYGAVVGAGSVVVHDLPPNSISVGSPARPVKERHGQAH